MNSSSKAKPDRVQRTAADTREALREQVLLLTTYAEQYDGGHRAFAKPMANSLRLLLHQTRTSASLLHQLRLRQGRFFSSAPMLSPRNLATECWLLITRITVGVGAEHIPHTGALTMHRPLPFAEWWSAPVLKGRDRITMCRRDVVLAVANTDGGSHIDPGMERVYHLFRTGELLGWSVSSNADSPSGFHVPMQEGPLPAGGEYLPEPQYACIRTVAHELLLTLQKYAAWSFSKPYAPKDSTSLAADQHGRNH